MEELDKYDEFGTNSGSFAKAFDDFVIKYETYDNKEKRQELATLLSRVMGLYADYFNDWKNSNNEKNSEKFMKKSEVYISVIQSLLSKVDYDLNQSQVEESLAIAEDSIKKARTSIRLANWSIGIAIPSVIVAVIALLLQLWVTFCKETPNYSTEQPQIEMPQTVLTEDSCSKPKDDVVCQKIKICDL